MSETKAEYTLFVPGTPGKQRDGTVGPPPDLRWLASEVPSPHEHLRWLAEPFTLNLPNYLRVRLREVVRPGHPEYAAEDQMAAFAIHCLDLGLRAYAERLQAKDAEQQSTKAQPEAVAV